MTRLKPFISIFFVLYVGRGIYKTAAFGIGCCSVRTVYEEAFVKGVYIYVRF